MSRGAAEAEDGGHSGQIHGPVYVRGCGSAVIVPLIDAIGIGLAGPIGVVFVLIAGIAALCTAKYGMRLQLWVEGHVGRL